MLAVSSATQGVGGWMLDEQQQIGHGTPLSAENELSLKLPDLAVVTASQIDPQAMYARLRQRKLRLP